MVYYFAYGSNMDKKQMEYRMTTRTYLKVKDIQIGKYSILCKGVTKKWKLTFNKIKDENKGTGYANIVSDPDRPDRIVEGIVYEIDDNGIKRLNEFEHIDLHYTPEEIEVEIDGKPQLCITYIANPNKVKEGLKPTKAYLDNLLAGKDYLSEEYYNKLKEIDTLD